MKTQQSNTVENIALSTRIFNNIVNLRIYLVPLTLALVTLFTTTICVPNAAIAATKFDSVQQKLINRFGAYTKAVDMMAYDECYEMLSAYSKSVITKDRWKTFVFNVAGMTSFKVFDVVIEPEGRRARVDVSATTKFDGKSAMQSYTWVSEGNKWVRGFAEDRRPQPLNSNSGDDRNIQNALGQMENAPISEKAWSGIFLTISGSASGSNINKSDYREAVMNYSTTKIKSAVEKITVARNASGELKAGLEEALIGHLLSWYASELATYKESDAWRKNRDELLANRRAFVKIGLDSDTLEKSFVSMNKALRTLAFPTVNDLN